MADKVLSPSKVEVPLGATLAVAPRPVLSRPSSVTKAKLLLACKARDPVSGTGPTVRTLGRTQAPERFGGGIAVGLRWTWLAEGALRVLVARSQMSKSEDEGLSMQKRYHF